MSKGSDYRPFNKEKFDKEFDRIFKKKEPKKKDEKKQFNAPVRSIDAPIWSFDAPNRCLYPIILSILYALLPPKVGSKHCEGE